MGNNLVRGREQRKPTDKGKVKVQRTKKITAMLLTLAMVITIVPSQTFASNIEGSSIEANQNSTIEELDEPITPTATPEAEENPEAEMEEAAEETVIEEPNLTEEDELEDVQEPAQLEEANDLIAENSETNDGRARIHYIGLKGPTDAILLESNGRFAMIDSGEDWDYPNGDDPRYPVRAGTDERRGFDMQVIHYLQSVGVTASNFDLYIGTHAHSDHIGLADDIIEIFRPTQVYLKHYSDSNHLLPEYEFRLWDNAYVYDQMLAAATRAGSTVIQDIAEESTVMLGDLTLQFLNTAVRTGVKDENENCLVINAIINGRTTVLSGDATDYVLEELYDAGKFADVDVIKLSHHGMADGFTERVVRGIRPKEAILTGQNNRLESVFRAIGTTVYATAGVGYTYAHAEPGVAAWVTEYSSTGFRTTARYAKEGWWDYKGDRYYIHRSGALAGSGENDSPWQKIGDRWYYIQKGPVDKCRVATGWQEINGNWYYMSEDQSTKGRMVVGWQKIDGSWYRFAGGDDGKVLTGWHSIGNEWYYFDAKDKGRGLTGWQRIDGQWYFLRPNAEGRGRLTKGWQRIDGSWYYFVNDSSGRTRTGWQKMSGKWYYFDAKDRGRGLTGWQRIDGQWYYLREDKDGRGQVVTGWQKIDGSWHHFRGGDSGRLMTGWQKIGGQWYYLDGKDKGKMLTGWQQINGSWYYMRGGDSGRLLTGWQKISGSWYYLGDANSGRRRTGWQKVGASWYYLGSDGKMQTGWQQINGGWYYLRGGNSGVMLSGWQRIGGSWYYLGSANSGRMLTGWRKIGGIWYYLDGANDGKMVTGRQRINGKWYNFASSGRWIS